MSNRKKESLVIDLETNEELVRSELTLASVKRFMKHYAQLGIYTRATHDGVEVKS